jgi:hypothetical protein
MAITIGKIAIGGLGLLRMLSMRQRSCDFVICEF